MIGKTRGIVLQVIQYNDNSNIVRVFTEQYGVRSYFLPKKKQKKKILLGPLALTDLEVSERPNTPVQSVKELRVDPIYRNIPESLIKSSILLFLNEVLNKCLREENKNESLFLFLFNSLLYFDEETEKTSDFHLVFLTKLTRFLGFNPEGSFSAATPYFDMAEGRFVSSLPLHSYWMDKDESELLNTILLTKSGFTIQNNNLNGSFRKKMITKILDYYRLHIENFKEIRSQEILEQIFHS